MLLLLALACDAPAGEHAPTPAVEIAAPAAEPAAPAETWPGAVSDYAWLPADSNYTPLWSQVAAPAGYARSPLADWPAWVRALPMKAPGSPVRTFRGETWMSATDGRLLGVVDLDVGDADLQQCADSVLRLRIEYTWHLRQQALASGAAAPDIAFHYTSGDLSRWSAWTAGNRPSIQGNRVQWSKRAAPSSTRATFEAWTANLFTYAGSLSLAREGAPVAAAEVAPGDFLTLGGSPGHAIVVLDVVHDPVGQAAVLLGEGYMPAMDLHLLAGPLDGWWPVADAVEIPTWPAPFPWSKLRRFTDG